MLRQSDFEMAHNFLFCLYSKLGSAIVRMMLLDKSDEIWNSGHIPFSNRILPREDPISLQAWTIKERESFQFLAAFEMNVQISGFPIVAVMPYDDPKINSWKLQ
jgi:hypothetical protein